MLVIEENRAGKHEHEYDPLGNLLTTTLPDGRRIENLYYGSGHQRNAVRGEPAGGIWQHELPLR
ncbi:TPA: hypothetical protein H2A08_003403 [Salmonella enterica]|uniref:RHS repeat protein n=1 Tax=Salmonella enterica subsp. enterica serovar Kintambo TaxID=1192730 RepID=A0A5W7SC88_SALET|nr:hypothetical protein [Salmonella enterica subsp. enterica serovar Kintambo]HAK2952880.1 hypothetical protein [Salmonella enterica]